jgi:ribosome maturation factor RimP
MAVMSTLKDMTPLIEEKLRFMQLYLYDLKFIRAGKKSILRIYIDRPGGVTIEDCEKASNAISILLDVENFSNSAYTLEVSSPGLDRELRREQDYKMVIGHVIRLTLNDPSDKPNQHVGKLLACERDCVTIETDDEQTVTIALSEVASGRIDVRFK